MRSKSQPIPPCPTILSITNIVVVAFFFGAANCAADTYIGKVVAIADGDTITVLDSENQQHKVRLAGIDAPEKKQDFGQVSKANLSHLIFNKIVTIESNKRDRYKREIGKVLLYSQDVNRLQVESGLAWHYS